MLAIIRTGLICFLALVHSSGVHCFAQSSERHLQFPNSYSAGTLIAAQASPDLFCPRKLGFVAEARGLVKLAARKQIEFIPSSNFYKNSDCLLKLPADAFHFVELRFVSMADEEDGLCDRAIARLGHITSLIGIDLDKSDASDVGLTNLGSMPNLQNISACHSDVTGSCFPKLLGCKNLNGLRLCNTTVSTDGLAALKHFSNLRRLSLVRCRLSLAGLEHVSRCSNLTLLDLDHNHNLDDKAVPLLLRLTKLKTLCLEGTKVSAAGLEQLARLHIANIRLPQPISSYKPQERLQLQKEFPTQEFRDRKSQGVDGYTKTLFAPITR